MKYHTIMIELSTKCNMRCIYCELHRPEQAHIDIQPNHLQRVIEFIRNNEIFQVCLHGHGEMTVAPNWHLIANQIIQTGTRLVTCTNLAKRFTPEEIDVLSRFTSITVSIDAITTKTFQALRHGGDVQQIIYNILLINIQAKKSKRSVHWIWNVVVCDKNIAELPDLCRLAHLLGIHIIQFNDLQKPDPPLPGINDLCRIAELPDIRPSMNILAMCENFCANNHITLDYKCLWQTLIPRL